jgi:hypothetical protein
MPNEPRDLQAFKTPALKGRMRLPVVLIAFGLGLIAIFAWFFSGYRNQRDRIFGEPKIFDVQIDGATVSQNNYPDVVNSVVRVPVGKTVTVSCESTYKREEVRFEARFGEALSPSDDCKFTTTAPSVPGQTQSISITMVSRKDGSKLDEESVEIRSEAAAPHVHITHLVDALKNEPIPSDGLYVPHEARVVGKLFVTEEPKEAADLRVAILIGRVDDPLGFLVALDPKEVAKGNVVAVSGALEPYRRYGEGGRGYYFQSGAPVAFGKVADSNVVFKAVAVVLTKTDLDALARRAWVIDPKAIGEKAIRAHGVTLAEVRNMAWQGLVSEDIRLVRLEPGKVAPQPVKWRQS